MNRNQLIGVCRLYRPLGQLINNQITLLPVQSFSATSLVDGSDTVCSEGGIPDY